MRTMSGGPCLHYDCTNRNSFGYCKTTVCINQNYQHEQLISTTNRTEPVVVKPLTNADKIRQMTDEELVAYLNNELDGCCGQPCDWNDPGTNCDKCWLAWLKQEVSE